MGSKCWELDWGWLAGHLTTLLASCSIVPLRILAGRAFTGPIENTASSVPI